MLRRWRRAWRIKTKINLKRPGRPALNEASLKSGPCVLFRHSAPLHGPTELLLKIDDPSVRLFSPPRLEQEQLVHDPSKLNHIDLIPKQRVFSGEPAVVPRNRQKRFKDAGGVPPQPDAGKDLSEYNLRRIGLELEARSGNCCRPATEYNPDAGS